MSLLVTKPQRIISHPAVSLTFKLSWGLGQEHFCILIQNICLYECSKSDSPNSLNCETCCKPLVLTWWMLPVIMRRCMCLWYLIISIRQSSLWENFIHINVKPKTKKKNCGTSHPAFGNLNKFSSVSSCRPIIGPNIIKMTCHQRSTVLCKQAGSVLT